MGAQRTAVDGGCEFGKLDGQVNISLNARCSGTRLTNSEVLPSFPEDDVDVISNDDQISPINRRAFTLQSHLRLSMDVKIFAEHDHSMR